MYVELELTLDSSGTYFSKLITLPGEMTHKLYYETCDSLKVQVLLLLYKHSEFRPHKKRTIDIYNLFGFRTDVKNKKKQKREILVYL